MSEKDLETRVPPFSNGTEYLNWLLNNCYQCKWGSVNNDEKRICAIEFSLDRARYTDGLVRPWIIFVAGIGKGGKCKVKDSRK